MKFSATVAFFLSAILPPVSATGPGEGHCETLVPYDYDSGASGSSTTVAHAGAAWIQLSLKLSDDARVKVTAQDRTETVLTAASVRADGGTSPQFDGDSVTVELLPPEGSLRGATDGAGRFMVDGVVVDAPCEEDWGVASICGPTDDRVASEDDRQGRIGGCTGWLISEDVFVQAGHCGTPSNSARIHFTYGTSSAPPVDQYAVEPGSYDGVNGGPGNDWGVGRLLANSITGKKPGVAQSEKCGELGCGWYNVGSVPTSTAGQHIRITGYGVAAVASRSQKTHVGDLVSLTGSFLRYVPDTTGGNSGSPVVHEETGDAVGVHTHGGCSANGGSNIGTRIDQAAFAAKIEAMIGPTTPSPPTTPNPTPPATPPPTPNPTAPPTPAATPAPCGTGKSNVKVLIHTDNYPSETEWTLKDASATVVKSGGPYTDRDTDHEEETGCEPDGAYTFEITDKWGDGICCSYGQGYYKIFDDGVEIKEGGDFGEGETHEFTTGPAPGPTTPPAPAPTNPPVPAPTNPPTPNPTNEPTPNPTDQPTPNPTNAPTPNPTNEPTTNAPTFFTCSQYGQSDCTAENECQWIGTCHNCGCIPLPRD